MNKFFETFTMRRAGPTNLRKRKPRFSSSSFLKERLEVAMNFRLLLDLPTNIGPSARVIWKSELSVRQLLVDLSHASEAEYIIPIENPVFVVSKNTYGTIRRFRITRAGVTNLLPTRHPAYLVRHVFDGLPFELLDWWRRDVFRKHKVIDVSVRGKDGFSFRISFDQVELGWQKCPPDWVLWDLLRAWVSGWPVGEALDV